MSSNSPKNASELSEQEKAYIREEVEKTPEELRSVRRKELAAEYEVELRVIGAITAWTTIRAKKALVSESEPQSESKVEQRQLVHEQIIRDHFCHNHAIGKPIERTRYEIQQIFSRMYSSDELLSMIEAIQNEKLAEDKTVIYLTDVDAKLGERVDYDNEKKNASRNWWLNLLWEYTKDVDKSKLNLLLLPGPECHELSPVISMGFPPENLHCYNLGKDPAASAVFVRNCQQQAVFNWKLGDLSNCLPKENERIYGGNLDFTGFYCDKNERILSYLPVPKNGKMYFSINFEKKREQKDVTGRYRQVVSYSQRVKSKNATFDENLFAQEKFATDAYFGHVSFETSEARKKALAILIQESLGVARSENWLCFDEIREMVLASGRFPDFDKLDFYEKTNAVRCVLSTFEDSVTIGLANAFHSYGFPELISQSLAQSLQVIVRKGSFNETEIMNCHQYEYCSPTGSPFISHFVVCENFYDQYRSMEKSMKFFIQSLTNYLKDIELNSSDDVLKKMRSNQIGEEFYVDHKCYFSIEGKGKDAKLTFNTSDPKLNLRIPLVQILRDGNRFVDFIKNHVSRSDKFAKKIDHSKGVNGFEVTNHSLHEDQENRPNSQVQPIHTLPHGQIVSAAVRVGRNEPCSCGSGKKFKKCCGLKR